MLQWLSVVVVSSNDREHAVETVWSSADFKARSILIVGKVGEDGQRE